MQELGTILGVWAHPDDDIYLSSGLMAVAAAAGNRVVDVTATRGEGGSMDEDRWPSERMAEVRTVEMRRSLEVLGVEEHRFLEGPIDVDMQTPLDPTGARQVVEIMREVQPDTVLTFGPRRHDRPRGTQVRLVLGRCAFADAAKLRGSASSMRRPRPSGRRRGCRGSVPFNIFLPGTPQVVPREALGITPPCPRTCSI